MNRLASIFSIFFLSVSVASFSQTGYVFVKKGIRKVKTYMPGDVIQLRLTDGTRWHGYINSLQGDTMIINGRPVPKLMAKEVLLKRLPKKPFPDGKTIALIAAGAAMTSGGLVLSDKDHKTEALIAGPVIGFGPLLIRHAANRTARAIKRKKYMIGSKFYLQVLDLGAPRNSIRAF